MAEIERKNYSLGKVGNPLPVGAPNMSGALPTAVVVGTDGGRPQHVIAIDVDGNGSEGLGLLQSDRLDHIQEKLFSCHPTSCSCFAAKCFSRFHRNVSQISCI